MTRTGNTKTSRVQRLTMLFGGLLGGLGVMLAAAASHISDAHLLSNASTMALAHAPVLIAISLGWEKLPTAFPASLTMMVGCTLFIGDLLTRQFLGTALFPFAAPLGGFIMLKSWFILAVSALLKAKPFKI